MIIKLKKSGLFGDVREARRVEIDDLVIKENLLEPEKENVQIFFRGQDASGILHLGKEEIERLVSTLKRDTGLVKKSKVLRDY